MNARNKLFLSVFLLSLFFPALEASSAELLILAPDEFIDELQPLKRFKDATGRPTLLISLSQVYGDSLFNGADDPERIKKCIAYHAQHSGVQHVILVGDVDKFPVRWTWWGRWMPNDPYFTGTWSIVNGKYRQSNSTGIPYYSWVDIGPYTLYTLEVDVTRLSGDQARILFADGSRAGCGYRVDISNNAFWLSMCNQSVQGSYTFSLNTSYRIRIVLGASNIEVWVNGSLQISQPRPTIYPTFLGKVGVGTFSATADFDNFRVTSSTGGTLWDENFNDGVANGFRGPDMEERGWAVSDLYYADLFKQGTYTFDNWNSSTTGYHGDVYGEIEFKLPDSCPGCTINNDNIDYLPDVSVGRIPASAAQEVTRYVNKVIAYELATSKDDSWFSKTILYEGSIGGGGSNDNIANYLKGAPFNFTVDNRHWAGDLATLTDAQRKQLVINNFNAGVGMVNYVGHGNFDQWSCVNLNSNDVASLANSGKWPVVLAGACFTGRFAPLPLSDFYTDVNNNEQSKYSECVPFPGTAARPNPLQVNHDVPSIAEDFLFNAGNPPGSAGAIAYLGERSAGRQWGRDYLPQYFFKAYSHGTTVGEMWKRMIGDYYWAFGLNQSNTWNYGPAMWDEGHKFDEPQKFILFGDPSVRVGGAFQNKICGTLYDGSGGPLQSNLRYRVSCDVTVPVGQKLTAQPSSSFLFESGRKIIALDANPANGLIINASSSYPVGLYGQPVNPPGPGNPRGLIVKGQLRVRGGGTMKFY
jgi:hypothetical protein